MLTWILVFLVLSIIAGALGFTGISEASAEIAQVIFFFFIVLLLVTLVLALTQHPGTI